MRIITRNSITLPPSHAFEVICRDGWPTEICCNYQRCITDSEMVFFLCGIGNRNREGWVNLITCIADSELKQNVRCCCFFPRSKLTCFFLNYITSKCCVVLFVSPLDSLEWVSILRILNVCFTYDEGDTRALVMKLDSVLQHYR